MPAVSEQLCRKCSKNKLAIIGIMYNVEIILLTDIFV